MVIESYRADFSLLGKIRRGVTRYGGTPSITQKNEFGATLPHTFANLLEFN